ncbi:hypothetical protein D6C89_10792 [Aureobasidium pullulans]|nr:hypothetical protein D6C89_10792 [Aureobasidium pullulans]
MSPPISPCKAHQDRLPPSPPKSPGSSLSRIVSHVAALHRSDPIARTEPTQTFSILEPEYAQLDQYLEQVDLYDYYHNKVRHEYDPSLGQLTFRMPTPRHDVLVQGYVDLMLTKIVAQARNFEQDYPAISQRLLQLQSLSTTNINLLVDNKIIVKSPDASFGYSDREYPQAVFEVSYSQDRRALKRLAWSYIMDSSHSIRCVLGLDLDYPRNRASSSPSPAHNANVSVWRPLVEIEGNIENMDVKQDVTAQCLGKDNPDHTIAVLSLRDLLGDEMLEDASSDVAECGIVITSREMITLLENAELFHQSSLQQTERALRERQAQGRNWRKRRITPEEELSEGREATYRNSEATPLDEAEIKRIRSLKLYTESHDQGYTSDPNGGNWTWFEYAIVEGPSDHAKVQDGIRLVWTSHMNLREDTEEYGWSLGDDVKDDHDLFRAIQPGDSIAVRICARFGGWQIFAKTAYLVVDLGPARDDLAPPPYAEIVSQVKNIHETIAEVNNALTESDVTAGLPAGFFRADVFQPTDAAPLRMLSFDGGGDANEQEALPIFDIIGGTSTGRLIAIMLGRLEMSVDECIEKYKDFMKKVFAVSWRNKVRTLTDGAKYDETVLGSCIKEVVKEKLGDEDAKLLDDREEACEVFVTAIRMDAVNNRAPVLLRSYQNPPEPSELAGIEVWKAARATPAAPTYFKSIVAGDAELVDGGLGANNPLGWLWNEVLSVFGPTRSTNCFLSIGTGIPKNVGIKGILSLPKALASAATNSELTNILFRTLLDAYAPTSATHKYWRLNVSVEIPADIEEKSGWLGFGRYTEKHPDNYEDVGALDDLLALEKLEDMTRGYIKAQDEVIFECCKALHM